MKIFLDFPCLHHQAYQNKHVLIATEVGAIDLITGQIVDMTGLYANMQLFHIIALLLVVNLEITAFRCDNHVIKRTSFLTMGADKESVSWFPNINTLSSIFQPNQGKNVIKNSKNDAEIELTRITAIINDNLSLLKNAAETKNENSDEVVNALLSLEKMMRERNKLDNGKTADETIEYLNGSWRLVFTTGTVDTQKKLGGRINYFPLKAVQSFDTDTYMISNGIYVGDFTLIKFFGAFSWNSKSRKLEFDFDQVSVFGFKFNLPSGGAAKIGQSTGLGSENNEQLIATGKRPFFNWISADSSIATARGGGGGLALWQRVDDAI